MLSKYAIFFSPNFGIQLLLAPIQVSLSPKTIRDKGNLLTYYRKLSVQPIQRNKTASKLDEK